MAESLIYLFEPYRTIHTHTHILSRLLPAVRCSAASKRSHRDAHTFPSRSLSERGQFPRGLLSAAFSFSWHQPSRSACILQRCCTYVRCIGGGPGFFGADRLDCSSQHRHLCAWECSGGGWSEGTGRRERVRGGFYGCGCERLLVLYARGAFTAWVQSNYMTALGCFCFWSGSY